MRTVKARAEDFDYDTWHVQKSWYACYIRPPVHTHLWRHAQRCTSWTLGACRTCTLHSKLGNRESHGPLQRICVSMCVRVCVCICVCVCVCANVWVWMCPCLWLCMSVNVCSRVQVHMCVCVWGGGGGGLQHSSTWHRQVISKYELGFTRTSFPLQIWLSAQRSKYAQVYLANKRWHRTLHISRLAGKSLAGL